MTFKLKKWLLKSISRQVSLLLVILLSAVLLLPAFYFYHSQKSAFETSTKQLSTQLINSLRDSMSKALLYSDHYAAWRLLNNLIKSNQKQYIGFIPDKHIFTAATSGIYIRKNKDTSQSNLRLYVNAISQENRSSLIILQLDLSILDQINQQIVIDFFLYYIFIIIIIVTGIAFGKWINDPLKVIEASLTA